jgi:hypothetical protein
MLILSCSNVTRTGPSSQSLVTAREVAKGHPGAEVVDLRDFDLRPCTMCEACMPPEGEAGLCPRDPDFAALAAKVRASPDIVFVVPHYAGLPSKLVILLEKLEEQGWLAHCAGRKLGSAWERAWIVAHGGQTGDCAAAYQSGVVAPLAAVLRAMGIKVGNDGLAEPLAFGVKEYFGDRDPGSLCYRKEDDLDGRRAVVARLVAVLAPGDGAEGAAP